MKIINEKAASKYNLTATCNVLDYNPILNEKNIDFCIVKINGRYPDNGYCSNLECDELCYILEGNGFIGMRNKSLDIKKGDIIFINKKEIYYWSGNLKLMTICTPAWSKEQCKLYNEEDL